MHPLLINFLQLLHFINLGVATSIPLERKIEIVFCSNISKIPEFILDKETEHRKKRKRREWKTSSKSLSLLKKGNSIFWDEKIFSKLFRVSPFSPPPFYHFKNPFPNHLKILDSFGTIFIILSLQIIFKKRLSRRGSDERFHPSTAQDMANNTKKKPHEVR
jgi:hypothetical protein